MKKLFFTAMAVLVFGNFGTVEAKSLSLKQDYIEFRDCDGVHFEAYIYASETLGLSHSIALIYAAGAHRACSQEWIINPSNPKWINSFGVKIKQEMNVSFKKISIIIYVISSTYLYSQNFVKVNYKVTEDSRTLDFEKRKKLKSDFAFMTDGADQVLSKLTFVLFVKDKLAYFKKNNIIIEPINNQSEVMSSLIYQLAESFVSDGEYYVDLENNLTFNNFDSPDGTHYIISSKADKYKWTLTKETKKISGYICYKATTQKITNNMAGTFTKPVTAWYAPSIPLSFGPKDYNGLPGLILELQEGTIGLYATKIDLNPKEKIEIKKPTKGKLMTQEEYDKSNGASYEKAKNLLGG